MMYLHHMVSACVPWCQPEGLEGTQMLTIIHVIARSIVKVLENRVCQYRLWSSERRCGDEAELTFGGRDLGASALQVIHERGLTRHAAPGGDRVGPSQELAVSKTLLACKATLVAGGDGLVADNAPPATIMTSP